MAKGGFPFPPKGKGKEEVPAGKGKGKPGFPPAKPKGKTKKK